MASGLFSPGAFDPNDPNYYGMRLPIPALSPQFQEAMVPTPQGPAPAVGPQELRQRGPMIVNAIPGYPNVTDPSISYTGGQGGAFDSAPMSPGLMPQAPAPAPYVPQTPPDSAPYAPRQYAGGGGGAYDPVMTGSTAAAPQSEGFLGMRSMADFGSRLERAGAWAMAKPEVALGFRNAENNEKNTAADNRRADETASLARQAKLQDMMINAAPNTKVEDSANGKFRVITTRNPVTGEVSFTRQAIPADEQAVEERKYPKAPASTDKTLNDDENALTKNLTLIREAGDIREQFRTGQVDLSLIGKTTAELQTLANSGDQRAANAMRVQAFIAGAANQQLRNEKGVQTDSDAKRIREEILAGSSRLNNKQVHDWIGRYIDQLETDTKFRSGRAVNVLKRYGPDFDPENYRSSTFEGYAATARQSRERDAESERANPYSGAAASAPRVTSPLDERLRNRFGAPGAR